jgi:hypothetical protein
MANGLPMLIPKWIMKKIGFTGTTAEVTAAITSGKIKEGDTVTITDDNSDTLAATAVSYDNTSSGMSATAVQGAIDELNTNLTDIFKIVETPTINVQSTAAIVGAVPIESGYQAIGIVGYIRNNSTDLPYISYIHIGNQTYNLAFANGVGDVKLRLLYVKI